MLLLLADSIPPFICTNIVGQTNDDHDPMPNERSLRKVPLIFTFYSSTLFVLDFCAENDEEGITNND